MTKKKTDHRAMKLRGYGPREVIQDICELNETGHELTVAQAGAAFGILSDMLTSKEFCTKMLKAMLHNGTERRRKKRNAVE